MATSNDFLIELSKISASGNVPTLKDVQRAAILHSKINTEDSAKLLSHIKNRTPIMAIQTHGIQTVTQEQVDSFITSLSSEVITLHGKKHCLVSALLENGFTITETSTCVDPTNFNEKIGYDVCTAKIKEQIWSHLGFELCTKISNFTKQV